MPYSARLGCIDPAVIKVVWPLAGDFIKSACERTELADFALIERDVLQGRYLLWVAWSNDRALMIEAAAVTRLCKAGETKVCEIVACGGEDRKRWLPLLAGIEQFARNEACARMQIIGRRGWERVLDGYKARFVVLQKELA